MSDTDLPPGYRWATEDECELYNASGRKAQDASTFVVVPLTTDNEGNPYTHEEADLAVPCWCWRCHEARGEPIMFMILCPTCGNKRCPHANDHDNACANSNDLGQPGSAYEEGAGSPTSRRFVSVFERALGEQPDEDDLNWAREDLGPNASDDEVREVAERRASERAREATREA